MALLRKKQLEYLRAMQIDVWYRSANVSTDPNLVVPAEPPQQQISPIPDAQGVSLLDWDALESRVSQCSGCALSEQRSQTVFGVGFRQADWLFVGEAPGAEEDRLGEPFVGRAGKLLDGMLFALGLNRAQVYIANTVKCRPPDNRNPKIEELAACNAYLQRQISLLQPKIMVALGGVAAKHLLQTEQKVGELRGRVFQYGDQQIPLLVTYHPAYLLRSPREKAKVWQDLQFAATLYNRQP